MIEQSIAGDDALARLGRQLMLNKLIMRIVGSQGHYSDANMATAARAVLGAFFRDQYESVHALKDLLKELGVLNTNPQIERAYLKQRPSEDK